ncbi:hypothetical protein WJU23_04995 [Prosthecobacter sp. SYSU 5D2]|uniref:hypothetical protein n=1 Tax=Prosthecobacter sp. SYSU 5D2 TaxID=3134134 RepID=UPI0031FED496
MKTFSLLHVIAILALSPAAHAQNDTAHHRAVYSRINDSEKSFQKVSATYKDDPLVFSLTGWMQGGEVLKIIAVSNEDGDGVEEYYLEDGKPLFVFSTYKKDHLSKSPKIIENRLYFKDGAIFKWLTNDKDGGILHAEDYVSEGERLTSNAAAFLKALKNKGAGKGKAKAAQVAEGVFTGIEQGDYFHWNMRTSSGADLSFFILTPDASVEKVLENPQAFAGKKCRVTWKKSMETIPEAGGKTEVSQILSVEWLGKK